MTDELALKEAEGGGMPIAAPDVAGDAGTSPSPRVLGATPAAKAIGRDIRLRQRVMRAYEGQERKALRDILKRGPAVIETRCDSHGKPHDRLLPNPSIRVARECRTAMTQLKKEIARLQSELAEAQAPPRELSSLEKLAARAGELRKP